MLVREVRAAARQWVREHGQHTPGFVGAYFHGSATSLPEDAECPRTSDLDLMLVLEDPGDAIKPGKFVYHGALLEASYIGRASLEPPEEVLSSAVLVGGFRQNGVILDPTGMLAGLHARVSHEFALRKWVLVRCERGAAPGRNAARWTDDAASIPLHDQATATVFGAGAMFPLFAAALRDWTVRKRYVVSQQILTQYGRPDFHEALLALLGCAGMPAARAEHHLAGMAAAFDAAASVVKTPYRFASDISPPARPISVDGTRELIERGLHREAVFWIAATHGRCRHIFSVDAPELLETFDPVYQELLDDLGIGSFEARKRRSEAVAAFQPRMWEVTQEILAKNAEIVD